MFSSLVILKYDFHVVISINVLKLIFKLFSEKVRLANKMLVRPTLCALALKMRLSCLTLFKTKRRI